VEQGGTEAGEIEVNLRRYAKLPEVEAEISALPTGTGIEFRVAIAQASAPETVVHGIRRLRRTSDNEGADALLDVLIQLATPLLERAARKQFPDSEDDRQEAVQRAAFQLWREVIDTSPKEAFWEVNFKHMVVLACSDAARKIRDQRKQERPFRRSDDGTWDEELLQPDPAFSDRDDHAFLDEVVWGEALSQLDGNVQRAIYLKARGLKIASKNPNEPTITSVLGVTGRTVQNYLREGEAILRRSLELNN
jgi:hypothetical protein